jgi:hypothetical protein
MANIVKSARGVEVNFDVLKIKQDIASAPIPTEVTARENFVEKRLKRKLKTRSIPSVIPLADKVEDRSEVLPEEVE